MMAASAWGRRPWLPWRSRATLVNRKKRPLPCPRPEESMHELSIAMSIVDLAEEEVARRGPMHVTAIHLKLGALSGVVKEALLSSFEMVCEDTPLLGSRLVVEEVPVVVYCPACKA